MFRKSERTKLMVVRKCPLTSFNYLPWGCNCISQTIRPTSPYRYKIPTNVESAGAKGVGKSSQSQNAHLPHNLHRLYATNAHTMPSNKIKVLGSAGCVEIAGAYVRLLAWSGPDLQSSIRNKTDTRKAKIGCWIEQTSGCV